MENASDASTPETAIEKLLLKRICRSIGEIQWLLVILVLLYLMLADVPTRTSPTVLGCLAGYFAFCVSASYITVLEVDRRFLIALHTLVMIAFITILACKTHGVNGPLVALYLLPIITSALALGRLATLLEVAAVAACYVLLMAYAQPGESIGSYAWSLPIANVLMYLLVGYLTTTLADALHAANRQLQKLPRLEQGMAANLRRWKNVTAQSTDAFVEMDSNGRITDWNPSAETLFGWRADEARGRLLSELIVPEKYRKAHRDGLKRFLATGEHRLFDQRTELEALDRDGRVFPVEMLIHDVKMPDQWYFDAFIHDISERHAQRTQLHQQAHIDPVTQLANRYALDARLAAVLERTDVDTAPVLVMIDLDNFKGINDVHGHAAGDRLLKQVGQRIKAAVRDRDLVARQGGDEFVILMEGIDRHDPDVRTRVARKIETALAHPYRLDNVELTVTASVGMAMPTDQHNGDINLFRRADQAMYEAKHAGKNQCRIAADYKSIA